jgi:hypothetical protein
MIAIVKGTAAEALAAAEKRSIPAEAETSFQWGAGWDTRLNVPDEHEEALCAWFCEQPNSPPFPIGTCLAYTRAESD